MKKKIALTALVISILGILGYYYVVYGGARNLSSEETAFTVSSKSIINEFDLDLEKSNKKYLEKAIVIQGTVTQTNAKQIILDHTIICDLKDLDSSVKKGQTVMLKGRIVGYDDLMGEIKLDQCFVINNN